ncbi:MAG: hypothetical protein ACI4S4_06585 [Candidatus Ornithospirochaeta sp.]
MDDRLKDLQSAKTRSVRSYREFSVDKEATNIFVVTKGEVRAATGWRENRENREVTGVVSVGEGEFVLYLPGEPMAVTVEDGCIVEHRRLV